MTLPQADPIFMEIFINAKDFETSGFEGRSAIEDEVDEALEESGLGEVTGGGGGIYGVNIDIEVDGEYFGAALELIRQVLRTLEVPKSTIIKRRDASPADFSVYE